MLTLTLSISDLSTALDPCSLLSAFFRIIFARFLTPGSRIHLVDSPFLAHHFSSFRYLLLPRRPISLSRSFLGAIRAIPCRNWHHTRYHRLGSGEWESQVDIKGEEDRAC